MRSRSWIVILLVYVVTLSVIVYGNPRVPAGSLSSNDNGDTSPDGLDWLESEGDDSGSGGGNLPPHHPPVDHDSYAPQKTACPSEPLLWGPEKHPPFEEKIRHLRIEKIKIALRDLFKRIALEDFDYEAFLEEYVPIIGQSWSGGGVRAMIHGAGPVIAMDSREISSPPSPLRGMLQATMYWVSLSGGSWLQGSIYVNGFTTVGSLLKSSGVWRLATNILTPKGPNVFASIGVWKEIHDEVNQKRDAGFDGSVTDYWGRAWSRKLFDQPHGGPGTTWSSIAKQGAYMNGEWPYPIVVANGRHPGETNFHLNTTIYEMTPEYLGSYDHNLEAFFNMEYIGSKVENGIPVNKNECYKNFDNAGFIVGTSSSIFNQFLLQFAFAKINRAVKFIAKLFLSSISKADKDIASFNPNPFFGVNPNINPSAEASNLILVDGGSDNQNLPLLPLYQPTRKVDVVFGWDNSADTFDLNSNQRTNWPNGTTLGVTYRRFLDEKIANGRVFPQIPDVNTFVNKGLNNRPTFFGCYRNETGPLLVYMPNAPYTMASNFSTKRLAYDDNLRDQLVENGYMLATQMDGKLDKNWPACVLCAIIHRQQERNNKTQTKQCRSCFKKYCWDRERNSEQPSKPYEPPMKMHQL